MIKIYLSVEINNSNTLSLIACCIFSFTITISSFQNMLLEDEKTLKVFVIKNSVRKT